MIKRWQWYLALAGILALCVVLLFFQKGIRTGSGPQYVLTYAENQTEDYPTTRGAQYFAELVEERTDGRIRIVVKYDAELGNEKEVLKQMQYGGIDFARISLSEISEQTSDYTVLQLPYLYKNSAHMWKVLESDLGDEFLQKAQELNLVGLSWYDAGVRSFYTSGKPITRLEDLQGMRIRVQESAIMEDLVEALGAKAVQVPYSGVYSYLEQGLADGAENNWPSYETMGHYEVAGYYTEDEHTRVPELQLASAHTWKKLTTSDQTIIRQAAKESADYERRLWSESENSAKQKAIAGGAQEITLSDAEKERFREAAVVIYEKYCRDQMELVEEIRQMAD